MVFIKSNLWKRFTPLVFSFAIVSYGSAQEPAIMPQPFQNATCGEAGSSYKQAEQEQIFQEGTGPWKGGATTNVQDLIGSTYQEAASAYGPADFEDIFSIGGGVTEFRVGVLNIYPNTASENHNIKIRELTWNDCDFRNTLWMHEVDNVWVVLDTLKWHKHTDF